MMQSCRHFVHLFLRESAANAGTALKLTAAPKDYFFYLHCCPNQRFPLVGFVPAAFPLWLRRLRVVALFCRIATQSGTANASRVASFEHARLFLFSRVEIGDTI